MDQEKHTKYTAVIMGALLSAMGILCLLWILLPRKSTDGYTADIYQDGLLVRSIPLTEVSQPYTFTVTGENGCVNVVEVRPGSIGILSADCPDRLCVRQGFVTDSRLPITCLPNRLVIRLRPAGEQPQKDTSAPDMITY